MKMFYIPLPCSHDLSSVGNKSRHTEEELCVKGLTAGQMYRIYLV